MIHSPLGSRYAIGGALGRSIKRASGIWLPTDVAGCIFWADMSDADTMYIDNGTTKVSSDGQAIYRIDDKSGNGYHAVQSSGGDRPAYKVNIKNGLSTSLHANDCWVIPVGMAQQVTTQFTIVGVVYVTDKDVINGIFGAGWFGGGASSFNLRISTDSPAGVMIVIYDGFMKSIYHSVGLSDATWYIYSVRCNSAASSWKLKYNTAAEQAKSVAQNPVLAQSAQNLGRIGTSTGGIAGYMGETICYNTCVSDDELTALYSYLNTKWAIYS